MIGGVSQSSQLHNIGFNMLVNLVKLELELTNNLLLGSITPLLYDEPKLCINELKLRSFKVQLTMRGNEKKNEKITRLILWRSF